MLKKKTVVNKTIVQMPSVAEKSTKEDEKTEAMRQRLFKMY
jgi:5-methylcytosine-specific restriction endonuclease McrBC regulatory subunit McrC